jgi:hypothetical protein
MPTFHRRIYWLLPTAASASGGDGGGGGGGGGGVSTAAADDGDSSAGGSIGVDAGETAPAAPAAGYGGKAAATDTSNLSTEASTLVLVHYLDERQPSSSKRQQLTAEEAAEVVCSFKTIEEVRQLAGQRW